GEKGVAAADCPPEDLRHAPRSSACAHSPTGGSREGHGERKRCERLDRHATAWRARVRIFTSWHGSNRSRPGTVRSVDLVAARGPLKVRGPSRTGFGGN